MKLNPILSLFSRYNILESFTFVVAMFVVILSCTNIFTQSDNFTLEKGSV